MSGSWEKHSTLHERIKLIRKRLNLSQADFAKRLGINPAHVSRLESGKAAPSEQLLRLIVHEYDISWIWLVEGKGRMELDFAAHEARRREIDLVSFGTYLTMFYQINVFVLFVLIDDLERYAQAPPNLLPPGFPDRLKRIKEDLPFGKFLSLIDKIVANFSESESIPQSTTTKEIT
jgi:transcriptional regulator with XRE-family HTH domain